MSLLWILLALLLCLIASALYSGSETGLYTLSRVQLDVEAEQGRRSARLTRWLSKDDAGLLIVILIGNNLAIEIATHLGESLGELAGLSKAGATVAVGFWLTPIAFFVAEVLPKEMFRRRPHGLLPFSLPLILVSRIAFWPLERVLRGFTFLVERLVGVRDDPVAVLRGRDRWRVRFEAGHKAGVLPDRAYRLMHNAMALRSTPVSRVMVPWEHVMRLEDGDTEEAKIEQLRQSRFSRLPVVGQGGEVLGYLHQIDALAHMSGDRAGGLRALRTAEAESPSGGSSLRLDVPAVDPELPVSSALLKLRGSGKRAAVVGTLEAPLGWLTLKDLVEELSGDLVGI